MPQPLQTEPLPFPSRPQEGQRKQSPLEATAQLLTFAPGFYAVDFISPNPSSRSDGGLRLPCARLEPLPPGPGNMGRCFVSVMAEGGWLSESDQPVFVRAVGDTAGAVLTIYKVAGGMPSPEFRIRRIQPDANSPATPPATRPVPSLIPDSETSLPLLQLVHFQTIGDMKVAAPDWAGSPGSGRQVEGFAFTPSGELSGDDIEYQAILGEEWNTPWSRGGNFCGSRGMGLPLLGFRVRVTGDAAEKYQCRYWGSFANKGIVGPLSDGAACEGDRALMEAMRVVIIPRISAAASETTPLIPSPKMPAKPKVIAKPLAVKNTKGPGKAKKGLK